MPAKTETLARLRDAAIKTALADIRDTVLFSTSAPAEQIDALQARPDEVSR